VRLNLLYFTDFQKGRVGTREEKRKRGGKKVCKVFPSITILLSRLEIEGKEKKVERGGRKRGGG